MLTKSILSINKFIRRRGETATSPKFEKSTVLPDLYAEKSSDLFSCASEIPVETDPGSFFQSCHKLLSSSDLDQNRLGLQRLKLMSKRKSTTEQCGLSPYHLLVYGGELGSFEEGFRYIFATMICDSPHEELDQKKYLSFDGRDNGVSHTNDDDDDSSNPYLDDEDYESISDSPVDSIETLGERRFSLTSPGTLSSLHSDGSDSDYSCWSEDLDEEPCAHGKSWGALHGSALQVLVNSLTHLSAAKLQHTLRPIPLHDTIWKNIIQSLVHNIETNHTAEITGLSLQILRLLHSIQPYHVQGLLQQSLFPQLVFLVDHYQDDGRFHKIHFEATRLLMRATRRPTIVSQ
jgi:hypothetical protein